MQKSPFSIEFIITGGTIDSCDKWTKDTSVTNKKSIIPKYIKSLQLENLTNFSEICMKDSRNLTSNDLKKMVNTVEKSSCKHIVITHWTYTMPDSARFLQANLKRKDQVIILTGSMLPMAEFTMSDWGFNLGYAIAKLWNLPNGIYVCMNGKVFSSNEVIKIISEGRFSSILENK